MSHLVPADPMNLSLEELLYQRVGKFLDQLQGGTVPDLYRVLVDQVDRAVLRQALERSGGQLNGAAALLGVDRNTLSRKVSRLKVEPELTSSRRSASAPRPARTPRAKRQAGR